MEKNLMQWISEILLGEIFFSALRGCRNASIAHKSFRNVRRVFWKLDLFFQEAEVNKTIIGAQ